MSFLLKSLVLFSKKFIFPEMSDSKFSCAISQGCGVSGAVQHVTLRGKCREVRQGLCAESLEQAPASGFTAQNFIEH